MKGWIFFWATVILFSLISFTYLSLKILIKGWPELREMFNILDAQAKAKNEQNG